MGLFNRKRNCFSNVVWRDKNGNITCPKDLCPQGCDDLCPIYLNTQATMLMQIGQGDIAFPLYEKILSIAPDFYDAWNNLGVIYRLRGEFQKSYEYYRKAHELNKKKPNPVYGLMLSSRDLGRYEECLYWCDIYRSISKDGSDKSIRDDVKSKIKKR